MEILSRGKLPSEKSYDWTCRDCKSVIRSKVSDGEIIYDLRDGDCCKTKCPVCNRDTYIDLKLYK